MSGFANSIIGGAQKLIRKAIQSPNYVPGTSGWSVNKDGSAEFDDATIRGTITAATFDGADFEINSDGAFFYSGAPALGNLIVSIASNSGVDKYGNVYGAGVNIGDQSGNHLGIDDLGRLFLFDAAKKLLFELSGNTGEISALDLTGAVQAVFSAGTAPFGLIGPAVALVSGNPESWHAVTVPTGMTGTIRTKILAESKFACVDVNVTITSTSTTAASFGGGSLPSAAYYPQAARQPGLSVQKAFTTVANASPRISIPTSGGIALNMPGFVTAGATCQVWGTVIYPTD